MSSKVPLKVIGNSNRIEAPEFCPYAEDEIDPFLLQTVVRSISPIICSVCKICSFVPEVEGSLTLTSTEKEKCISYLTKFNTHFANIINGQISYLAKKNRAVLAFLISANVLNNVLNYANDTNEARANALFHYYIEEEVPIFYLHGSPVYFARRLTMSPIQVVGEAPWK